jgi:drug/metabolite transporter (DMT)-like permease
MTPLVAAVIATKLGDDRLSRQRLAGLALGFLGLATIYGLDLGTADAPAVIALFSDEQRQFDAR